MATAQRPPSSKSPLSQSPREVSLNRQDSSQSSDTSNLVSSLTRDISQSPRDGSASPTTSLSMRSDPMRSLDSPSAKGSLDSSPLKQQNNINEAAAISVTASGAMATAMETSTKSTGSAMTMASTTSVTSSAVSSPSTTLKRKSSSSNSKSSSPAPTTTPGGRAITKSSSNVSRIKIQGNSEPRTRPATTVKEAMSPSVAESVRSVFASFIWHEGIVHDAMAVASYLKFHPNLSKNTNNKIPKEDEIADHEAMMANNHKKNQQRHSVEVLSSTVYLNANNIDALDKASTAAALNANVNNKNMAALSIGAAGGEAKSATGATGSATEAIPEDEALQFNDDGSGLPPTIKLLVLLWEDIRSYCVHAILQQVIVASPLHMSAASTVFSSTSKKSIGSEKKSSSSDKERKSRKSKRARDETLQQQQHFLAKAAEEAESAAASTAASVAGKVLEEALCQLCEMCGHYFQHPVTYHMRIAHPGCGGHAGGKGYNSGGHYCSGWAGNCGDGGNKGSSWYLICEKCRENHLRRANPPPPPPPTSALRAAADLAFYEAKKKQQQQHLAGSGKVHRRKSSLSKTSPLSAGAGSSVNSHIIMNNNAMFLLDLSSSSSASAATASQNSTSRKMTTSSMMGGSLSAVSELGALDPNPFPLVPFQCFNTLGVRDSHLRMINDELVLDEVMKSDVIAKDEAASEISPPEQFQNSFTESNNSGSGSSAKKPFGRSVSVGHHGSAAQAFVQSSQQAQTGSGSAEMPDVTRKRNSSCEHSYSPGGGGGGSTSGAGDFLSNPSSALQKLFTVERGRTVVTDILQRPVMSFVLQWNDLESLQIAMTTALRKAACRTYAMQALNWLLRSVSQPACLHDLLWCFVSALESNTSEAMTSNLNEGGGAALDKDKINQKNNVAVGKKDLVLFDHPTEDISIAGEAIQPLPSTFHGLLQTVSDLMLLLPVGSSLQQIAITCWCIKFRPQDHNFLHQSHVFSTISKILSR